MAFSTAGGGPSGPQMNVTPLIDVLLVLIIIFMIVVIEEKPHGLEAQIPQEANPKDHTIPPPDDDDIEFQRVADVIDTAHNAGVDRLGLLHDETAAVHHRDH
ncbi:MAG: biopolymer transporter ExbD [Acidobacteriales bacterium]|nr:biopolymer transporter ExbD [Terriglobales bacterium]